MASKQQRDSERRRLQRQSERRREAAARRKKINLIVSIVAVVVVVGGVIALLVGTSGSDDKPVTEPSPTSASPSASASASSTAAQAAYPCTWTPAAAAAKRASAPSTRTPPKTGTATVKVVTSQGPLTFTLNRAEAPCAVASFVSLVGQKYFDSTPCHRLTTGSSLSVLQCGDPSGKGSGGPGYSFADELSGKEKYSRGVLAMANSGPNTNGSQFFIVYKNSQLPPSYTVFGRVSAGLGVVDKVAAKGVTGGSGDGAPALPVTLTKLTTTTS